MSPDGIQVAAARHGDVFWRYYTREGQNSSQPGNIIPISATVIANTLVYMQTLMLNAMIAAGPPIFTVTS